jgi:very-short-patch-repair endonuclease
MARPQNNPRRKSLKTEFARELRRNITEAERKLWALLRRKQFAGLRFRRQQAIGPYVVDFYCASAKLIVELDGGQHFDAQHLAYDAARTQWLEQNGFRVVRFANIQFQRERDSVVDAIWHAVKIPPSP